MSDIANESATGGCLGIRAANQVRYLRANVYRQSMYCDHMRACVCVFVCDITHECTDACRPNMVSMDKV